MVEPRLSATDGRTAADRSRLLLLRRGKRTHEELNELVPPPQDDTILMDGLDLALGHRVAGHVRAERPGPRILEVGARFSVLRHDDAAQDRERLGRGNGSGRQQTDDDYEPSHGDANVRVVASRVKTIGLLKDCGCRKVFLLTRVAGRSIVCQQ